MVLLSRRIKALFPELGMNAAGIAYKALSGNGIPFTVGDRQKKIDKCDFLFFKSLGIKMMTESQ
ncbi:hypothetical protein GNF10_15335 [Nostoc sp. UCD121]|uniref:hypothetical protein n=1 Tax=unclassified Nostoc TaxID=2593658 RepID=UPI00162597CE|nr:MULTISPECIES: hypothetical protein [unclassified Nostoc]MBC1223958.1 hypothetical protein [Nostoc sp. UCD120]MBC1277292.1 hypothetical protein [Nostoc sp. UCD121]MBC1294023.1 hypothetical protein [Nostoc sp. UCD122]